MKFIILEGQSVPFNVFLSKEEIWATSLLMSIEFIFFGMGRSFILINSKITLFKIETAYYV